MTITAWWGRHTGSSFQFLSCVAKNKRCVGDIKLCDLTLCEEADGDAFRHNLATDDITVFPLRPPLSCLERHDVLTPRRGLECLVCLYVPVIVMVEVWRHRNVWSWKYTPDRALPWEPAHINNRDILGKWRKNWKIFVINFYLNFYWTHSCSPEDEPFYITDPLTFPVGAPRTNVHMIVQSAIFLPRGWTLLC